MKERVVTGLEKIEELGYKRLKNLEEIDELLNTVYRLSK
jgi:hypothetical protein